MSEANVAREKNFLKCIVCWGSPHAAPPKKAKYVEFSSIVNFEAKQLLNGTRYKR